MVQDAQRHVIASLQDHVTLLLGPVLMVAKMAGLEINAKVKEHKESDQIGIWNMSKMY